MFSLNSLFKGFENFQPFSAMPFNMQDMLETQRRNIQAVTEATQRAAQNIQTVAQRQREILSQIAEDNSELSRELMGEGTAEEKMAQNARVFKKVYQRTIKNMREISELIGKSNEEAADVINNRVTAAVNELQAAIAKSAEKNAGRETENTGNRNAA